MTFLHICRKQPSGKHPFATGLQKDYSILRLVLETSIWECPSCGDGTAGRLTKGWENGLCCLGLFVGTPAGERLMGPGLRDGSLKTPICSSPRAEPSMPQLELITIDDCRLPCARASTQTLFITFACSSTCCLKKEKEEGGAWGLSH